MSLRVWKAFGTENMRRNDRRSAKKTDRDADRVKLEMRR